MRMGRWHRGRECVGVEAGGIHDGLQALDGILELEGAHEYTLVTAGFLLLTVSMYFLRLARWRAWARALRERDWRPVPVGSSSWVDGGEWDMRAAGDIFDWRDGTLGNTTPPTS
jgi:hypothetical protein